MKWLNHLFGGPKDMTALAAGTNAPDFSLPGLDGSRFSLQEALRKGPVVAAFFKVSCPVCQYAFPFFERLYKAHGNKNATFVGVSQDNARDTASFLKEFGVSFPALIDDPNGYAVSNAYGLTNVPSLFVIGQDGKIELSSVGWVRQDVEQVGAMLAGGKPASSVQLLKPGEDVRDFRAG